MSTVSRASLDQKLALAKRCSRGTCTGLHTDIYCASWPQTSYKPSLKGYVVCSMYSCTLLTLLTLACMSAEATLAGAKAAAVATIASAIPTVSFHLKFQLFCPRCRLVHARNRETTPYVSDLSFCFPCSAGECEDAAVGESQHQPHRPGPRHLHRCVLLQLYFLLLCHGLACSSDE